MAGIFKLLLLRQEQPDKRFPVKAVQFCSSVYFKAMLFSPGILTALLYHEYGIFANRGVSGIRHNACAVTRR